MKKNTLLIILLILAVSAAMLLTGCSKSSNGESAPAPEAAEEAAEEAVEEAVEEAMTLEKFVSENESVQEQLAALIGDTQGLDVSFLKNSIVYTFDFSKMGSSYTKELIEAAKTKLEEGMEAAKSQFGDVSKKLEELTGIEGIHTVVNYTWGDEVIATGDYTAEDAE